MKMGITASPWRYDAASDQAFQSQELRLTAILRYGAGGSSWNIARWFDCRSTPINFRDQFDVALRELVGTLGETFMASCLCRFSNAVDGLYGLLIRTECHSDLTFSIASIWRCRRAAASAFNSQTMTNSKAMITEYRTMNW